ncbi:hypothetical protein niasHT_014837 [Heterodera trifolii]|uniref:Uncharacterized protein n=1 Tax=Heterodera trifolii TaxID=157864 RepID=A0ABD2L6M9_9BILA
MAITQPLVPHLPAPPPVQQLVHQAGQTLNQSQGSSNSDDEDDQTRNGLSFQSVNMISDAHPMALEGYKDDCVVTFDRWAKRFREYMDAFGRKLDEKDKLARLVIYLDGVPKRILEKMDPNRKATIDLALANLRTDLDSPQSKGLSKQALIACRQLESEPVKDFLYRFIPLAEASVSDVKDDTQKEAQLRELFLERLWPNISLVMKMLDMSRGKKFEQLCWEAREVEIMLSAQAGGLPFVPQFASVQAMDNQNFQSSSMTPPGNFKTLAPTQQNRYPPRQNNWQDQPRQSNRNQSGNRGRQNRDRDMGHGPTNDRRWNNRPYCNYCRRVGHVANACRTRLRDYQNQQRGGYDGNARSQPQRRTPATGANAIQHDRSIELLNEIASGLRNLSLDMNQHKSLNDVNVVENSSRATALPNNSENEYEANCPASGRSSPWEGVRMMPRITPLLPFIVFLIAIILGLNGAKAAPPSLPLICQTDIQPTIWGLPKQVQCPLPAEVAAHVPLIQTRELFVINDFEHNTQAWACRKIKKKARKFTTLSGVPVVEPIDSELLEMSVDECKRMVEHKTCDFGILTERDGLWGTDHTLDLTPRLWLLGSFSWSYTQSEDCFAFKTQVFHHFGEETIRTPLGTTSHCRYLFGNCTLNDKSILVWTPEKQLNCRYTSIGKFKGRYVSNTWLSDDAQFGLHFKTKTPKVNDCKKTLTVSEQGFATRIIVSKRKRTKRSYGSVEHLGLATSPELNAKLTYLDEEWVDSLMYALRHSFKTQCDFFSAMTKMLTSTHLIDPTSLARSLFNNTKVYAVRAGSSLLKIWPCVQLKKGEFRFKPTRLDNKCFDKLPIEFVTQSENRLAFLDPSTMIIVPDSAKVACAQHRKIVV